MFNKWESIVISVQVSRIPLKINVKICFIVFFVHCRHPVRNTDQQNGLNCSFYIHVCVIIILMFFFLNFVSSISWSSHLLNHYKPNCLHFNSLTTSHQFNCLQNSLIWIYGVLLSFGHLMMIPCGSKHVGIFNVMS